MGRSDRTLRTRFWVESALMVITSVVLAVTLVWRDWLEAFGVDPDHHNGAAEWLVVSVLAGLTIVFALSARTEWRRAAAAR
jgi:hypothetical protein